MDNKYHIEIYDKKRHNTKEFQCDVEELDRYLKEQASQESKKKISVTYIIHEVSSEEVIGFYTLSSFAISVHDLSESAIKKLPKYKALPTVLLGRLAVDRRYQGKRIGEYLLLDALKRSYILSKQIASYAVVVDAKNDKARIFYEKYGFIRLITHPFTLYLPMKTIEMLVI